MLASTASEAQVAGRKRREPEFVDIAQSQAVAKRRRPLSSAALYPSWWEDVPAGQDIARNAARYQTDSFGTVPFICAVAGVAHSHIPFVREHIVGAADWDHLVDITREGWSAVDIDAGKIPFYTAAGNPYLDDDYQDSILGAEIATSLGDDSELVHIGEYLTQVWANFRLSIDSVPELSALRAARETNEAARLEVSSAHQQAGAASGLLRQATSATSTSSTDAGSSSSACKVQ